MPNLVLPTRALKVVNTSIELFHRRGFHIVGVDRLVKDEPYRVCRRVNILRDYPDDKTKLYPRN